MFPLLGTKYDQFGSDVVLQGNTLAVGAWAVYKLCEAGDLPHVRINNSIRVRSADFAEFIAACRKPKRRQKEPSRE